MIEEGQHIIPDILIPGVPKSGTTFLFDALAAHPDICPANPKETYFHLSERNPYHRSGEPKTYYQFFKEKSPDFLHMDGSQFNMFDEELLSQVNQLIKKPKVIIMLREPARRIYSSFQYTSHNLSALRGLSFAQYVGFLLEENWNELRTYCKDEKAAYSMTHEKEYTDYLKYLRLWRDAVGEENLKILIFEEFKVQANDYVIEVLEFLGLTTENYAPISPNQNATQAIKHKQLHYWLNKAFAAFGYRIPFKAAVKKLYGRLQHTDQLILEEDEVALRDLKEYFAPQIRPLAEEFQLNLSKWQ